MRYDWFERLERTDGASDGRCCVALASASALAVVHLSARWSLASIGPSRRACGGMAGCTAPHRTARRPRRPRRQHALLILKYRMIDDEGRASGRDAGTFVRTSVVAFVVKSTTTSRRGCGAARPGCAVTAGRGRTSRG